MKRFGVNWIGIFAANAVISAAVFTGFLFLMYELFAARSGFLGRPQQVTPGPMAIFPYVQALTMCCISTWQEYEKYKEAVNGTGAIYEARATSWTPDVHPIPRHERFRGWLKGTSVVGVPFALAHFVTGRPSVNFVILLALLAPALIVLAQMAKCRLYRTGLLNRRITPPAELLFATPPVVALSVTRPVGENAILSVGSGNKP